MALAIYVAAVPYKVKDFWNEHARPVKRSRRTLWRAYESSQRLAAPLARSKKRLARLARARGNCQASSACARPFVPPLSRLVNPLRI
jgi:hypothetical protein